MKFKLLEAALPMNTSHDALRDHLRRALRNAHGVREDTYSPDGPWVTDVFPNHVVYQHEGQTYKRKYTVTTGAEGATPTISLGDAKKCHMAYMDSKESSRSFLAESETPESVTVTLPEGAIKVSEKFTFELVDVKEAVVQGSPAIIPIKIINPGWGSSAYYPKETLKRDGPSVFKKGTHMYWNHQTVTEEMERPEGDLNDLAAVLTENAKWDDNGPKGPGLYSKAKVFSDYSQQVTEKGAVIGVSINAAVKAHEGEAEGKSGLIADNLLKAFSIDFVTKAGAGGAPIVPVLESQRRGQEKENTTMTEQEIQALQTRLKESEDRAKVLESDNAKLVQSQNVILAVATVGAVLHESGIEVGQKVIERCCQTPVMKDGKLDQDWVKGVVADLTEGFSGKVEGMGHRKAKEADGGDLKPEEVKEGEDIFKSLGVPEAGLKYVMGGTC